MLNVSLMGSAVLRQRASIIGFGKIYETDPPGS
jgi:hypothetical protein